MILINKFIVTEPYTNVMPERHTNTQEYVFQQIKVYYTQYIKYTYPTKMKR